MTPNPENNYIKAILLQIGRHAMNNPITTALAAMTCLGGFLILMFFLHINFMPDIDLQTASALLYASAFIGAFLAAAMMALLVAPGVILFLSVEKASNVTPGYLLSVTFGAAFVWLWILLRVFDFVPLWAAYVGGALTTLLLPFFSYMWSKRTQVAHATNAEAAKKGLDPMRKPKRAYVFAVFLILFLALVQVSPMVIFGVLGMTGDLRSESKEGVLLILGAILILVAMSAAHIGNSNKSELPKVVAIIAPILLFLALAWLGNLSSLPKLAIQALGQGEINAARITVSGKTCQEIQQTLGQKVCSFTSNEEAIAICPVRIRSRIGSQVVLEFAPMQMQVKGASTAWVLSKEREDGQPGRSLIRRVILEKAKLLSWQPLQAFPETSLKAENPLASEKVATWLIANDANNQTLKSSELRTILSAHCGEL